MRVDLTLPELVRNIYRRPMALGADNYGFRMFPVDFPLKSMVGDQQLGSFSCSLGAPHGRTGCMRKRRSHSAGCLFSATAPRGLHTDGPSPDPEG